MLLTQKPVQQQEGAQQSQTAKFAKVTQTLCSMSACGLLLCVQQHRKVSADSVYGQQHQPGSSKPWDNGIGYALATILLRLPGHAPMLSFGHIMDIPLIVPHAKLSQEQVCIPVPHRYLYLQGKQLTSSCITYWVWLLKHVNQQNVTVCLNQVMHTQMLGTPGRLP